MDIYTKEHRHKIMAKIHCKDTKPELIVRSTLHRMGFRFRIHNKKLIGTPDITLPKWNTVIFVHGCFWHRHLSCRSGNRVPKTNQDYWIKKFERNIGRDKKIYDTLEALGWKVIIVWECQAKNLDELKKYLYEEITEQDNSTISIYSRF